MPPTLSSLRLICAATILFSTATNVRADEDAGWTRIKLDERFRSEGVAAADVNRDGRLDVIAGDVWYEAPEGDAHRDGVNWTTHEVRKPGDFVAGKGYSSSFCNFAWDVNRDGWTDLILIGFPGEPFHWYENPKGEAGHWKAHLIWHSACNESPEFEDVDGDGTPEIVVGSQPESQMGYLAIPPADRATKKWDFRAISEKGEPLRNGSHRYYHGLGVADFNGDGRSDVLIPHGYWRAPEDRAETPWTFTPFTLSKSGEGDSAKAANMYAEDLDMDGDRDVVMSSAHAYGVWWFENQSEKGKNPDGPKFKYHEIDTTYSQTHAMEYVDINGDGQRDIVTGKRFFAHNGNDPGGKDKVVMYWYEVKRKRGAPPEFIPHEIVAGRDTGVGTQFQVIDVNGDKRPDVVLSNKKGVNVLLQGSR